MAEVELAATGPGGVLLGKPVRTMFLVDSGADVTMLDGGLATTLGLNLHDPQFARTTVGGVGQGGVEVARASIKMSLCERWLDVPVNFTIEPIKHPQLLGREGAFDALFVAFWHSHNAMLVALA